MKQFHPHFSQVKAECRSSAYIIKSCLPMHCNIRGLNVSLTILKNTTSDNRSTAGKTPISNINLMLVMLPQRKEIGHDRSSDKQVTNENENGKPGLDSIGSPPDDGYQRQDKRRKLDDLPGNRGSERDPNTSNPSTQDATMTRLAVDGLMAPHPLLGAANPNLLLGANNNGNLQQLVALHNQAALAAVSSTAAFASFGNLSGAPGSTFPSWAQPFAANAMLQPRLGAPSNLLQGHGGSAGAGVAQVGSFAPGLQSLRDSSIVVAASNDHAAAPANSNRDSKLTGRDPITLYMTCDDESLSEYQCLVRKQVELFEARQEEVESNAKGRNKPIVLGQVGIRCRHCSMLTPRNRLRGAMYYPAKLNGLYQAAQSMASGHLCYHCQHIPDEIRQELLVLRERKSSAGGGKKYWGEGVRVLGVFEDEDGLRFEKR